MFVFLSSLLPSTRNLDRWRVLASQTSEIINLSAPCPAWVSLPNINVPRPRQFTSVLLPDGKLFIAGGVPDSPGPAEIFDPTNPNAGSVVCGAMKHIRGYHSASILLVDHSVLISGTLAGEGSGATTPNERYFQSYCFKQGPAKTNSPATTSYDTNFTIQTPNASPVAEVVIVVLVQHVMELTCRSNLLVVT